uniref:G_PROTEIN_RECEP_F1_2 domain-containing protein n=1 Tax=Caenorhabditis tropicalis TaxID=1561998 RepID=A0A1I7U9P3_9PELO
MPTKDPYNWTAYSDYLYYDYECEDLEDSDYCDSGFYYYEDYEDPTEVIHDVGHSIRNILAVVTVIMNVLHLFVLLQKQLRSTAIFIFMIGVAVSDIFSFSLSFSELPESFYLEPLVIKNDELSYCIPDKWIPMDLFGQFISTGHGITRRISVWLALIMAVIRTLSISFPMSNRVQKLATAGKAIVISAVVFGKSFIIESWQLFLYGQITRIENIIPNFIMSGNSYDVLVIEIVLKLTPAVLYPILTVLLFFELREVQKRRNNMRNASEKTDNTITLIFVMTFNFMVTEMSFGIGSVFKLTWNEWSYRDSYTLFKLGG